MWLTGSVPVGDRYVTDWQAAHRPQIMVNYMFTRCSWMHHRLGGAPTIYLPYEVVTHSRLWNVDNATELGKRQHTMIDNFKNKNEICVVVCWYRTYRFYIGSMHEFYHFIEQKHSAGFPQSDQLSSLTEYLLIKVNLIPSNALDALNYLCLLNWDPRQACITFYDIKISSYDLTFLFCI